MMIQRKGYYYQIHYKELQFYVPMYRLINNNMHVEIWERKQKLFKQLPLSACEINVKATSITDEEEQQLKLEYAKKYAEYDQGEDSDRRQENQ